MDEIYFSDHTLNDMRQITEVIEYLYENPPEDESVTKKMEFVVYGKILALRGMTPKIERLNGMSIEGLCAAISLSRKKDFGYAVGDEELTKLVKGYLKSVEPLVKAKADELKNTVFTEDNCAI